MIEAVYCHAGRALIQHASQEHSSKIGACHEITSNNTIEFRLVLSKTLERPKSVWMIDNIQLSSLTIARTGTRKQTAGMSPQACRRQRNEVPQ
jgi:hypothetical protein